MEIVCDWCGISRVWNHIGQVSRNDWRIKDSFKVVLRCWNCFSDTYLEVKEMNAMGVAIDVKPGRLFDHEWHNAVTTETVRLFEDARKSYMAGAYGAALAMGRAAVEEALENAGFSDRTLEAQIDKADKASDPKQGILGPQQVALAHSSRLYGRDVLHRKLILTSTEALSALNATVHLVQFVAEQPEAATAK